MGLMYDARQIELRDPAARTVAGVILLNQGIHAPVFHYINGLRLSVAALEDQIRCLKS